MSSRVFSRSGPKKDHLLKGRGVNGEVLDLRADVQTAIDRLEAESILDVQWSFDGHVLPAPGTYTGQYGFCHTTGAGHVRGTVWFDDGTRHLDVTKKGIVISPRIAIVGEVSIDANGIYLLSTATPPYTWIAKGGSGGGSGDASSIQSTPVNAGTPQLDQVLRFDGAEWTPDWLPDTAIRGGFRALADAAERGAIPDVLFKTGMVIYQWDVQRFLQLDDAESWRVVPTGHTIVDYGTRLPFTNDLYFKGFELFADEIDDNTLVKFPMEVTTAERVAITHLHPGLTVFDSDLQRLVTFIENSWRVV